MNQQDSTTLLIPLILATFLIPLINFLKKKLGWEGPENKTKNVWLAFGVSMVGAAILLIITGSVGRISINEPDTWVAWFGTMFTVSTMIYRNLPGGNDSPSSGERLIRDESKAEGKKRQPTGWGSGGG